MAKPRKQDPAGIPVQAPTIPVDEYRGMGGSYVIDPETGKRVRVAGPSLDEAPAVEQEAAMEI